MGTYVLKRVLLMVPTFFAVSLIVFLIINLAPGQPGQLPTGDGTQEATGTRREAWRVFKTQFGLDRPILLNLRFLTTGDEVARQLRVAVNRDGAAPVAAQVAALEWLEDLGPGAVPHLLALALSTGDAHERLDAVRVLGQNARRPMAFAYGARTDAATDAQNRSAGEENERLAALVWAPGAPEAEQRRVLAAWRAWFEGVRAERYEPSWGRRVRDVFLETRFARYWWNLLHLDLGISHLDKKPVLGKLLSKLKYSLTLSVPSLVLAYVIAVPLGVFSAVRRDSLEERALSVGLFMLYSLPTFFVGTLLLVLFSTGSDYCRWFPTGGWQSEDFRDLTTLGKLRDVLWHLALPVLCQTYGSLAALSRYARSGLLEVVNADYVRTARAKGLPESRVILKHALRNGLIPVVTLLGTVLPVLIGGSVIVEVIFGIPGMGLMTYEAILNRDYNAIMAVELISALLVMLGILCSDLLYAAMDPRITYR